MDKINDRMEEIEEMNDKLDDKMDEIICRIDRHENRIKKIENKSSIGDLVEKNIDVFVDVKQNDDLLLAINSVLNTSIILLTVYSVFSLLRKY
jgi:hypothetical protein